MDREINGVEIDLSKPHHEDLVLDFPQGFKIRIPTKTLSREVQEAMRGKLLVVSVVERQFLSSPEDQAQKISKDSHKWMKTARPIDFC